MGYQTPNEFAARKASWGNDGGEAALENASPFASGPHSTAPAGHYETVAPADLLQDFKKQVAWARYAEKRAAAVATAGGEMKMTGVIATVQIASHGSE